MKNRIGDSQLTIEFLDRYKPLEIERPLQVDDAKITVLTAHDFEASTEFQFGLEHPGGTAGTLPDATDDAQAPAAWLTPEAPAPVAGNDTTEAHALPDSDTGE